MNNRKLVDWIEWISSARGGKFIDFGPGTLDVVDEELAIGFVDSFGYDDIGGTFIDVIVAVIKYLSNLPWLFNVARPGSLNIGYIEMVGPVVEEVASVIGYSFQVHTFIVFVIVFDVHINNIKTAHTIPSDIIWTLILHALYNKSSITFMQFSNIIE